MTILYSKEEWEIFKKSQAVSGTTYGGEPLRFPTIVSVHTWTNSSYSYLKYEFGYEELIIAFRRHKNKDKKDKTE